MIEIEPFPTKKNNCPTAKRTLAGGNAPPRGQALGSLVSSDLRERFYSWRGASGRRYVCSVFPSAEESTLADFSQGVVIGVAGEGASRRPICVLFAREFESERGRLVRQEARALGASEWHVHFCADDADFHDLAGALLN